MFQKIATIVVYTVAAITVVVTSACTNSEEKAMVEAIAKDDIYGTQKYCIYMKTDNHQIIEYAEKSDYDGTKYLEVTYQFDSYFNKEDPIWDIIKKLDNKKNMHLNGVISHQYSMNPFQTNLPCTNYFVKQHPATYPWVEINKEFDNENSNKTTVYEVFKDGHIGTYTATTKLIKTNKGYKAYH